MEERRYKAYITDTLQAINTILATRFGGSYLPDRWVSGYIKSDTRTGDEVAAEVIKLAGLSLGDTNGL